MEEKHDYNSDTAVTFGKSEILESETIVRSIYVDSLG